MKIRSLVSILPMIAVASLDLNAVERADNRLFAERIEWFRSQQRDLLERASEGHDSDEGRLLLSFLNPTCFRRLLAPLLDENEFLSPFGIRSLSRRHAAEPFRTSVAGQNLEVAYWPAESESGMFGGNSNWRGPIWAPANFLIIDALRRYHEYYGDRFTVECPTGSGNRMTLDKVADEISRRFASIFERGTDGRRPVFGGTAKFQSDSRWRDSILFYEYFHGDNGAGLGASHQTGWSGLAAVLMEVHAGAGATAVMDEGAKATPLGLRAAR
jgi:hypothetical protein